MNIILVSDFIFAENLTWYRKVKNSAITHCADYGIKMLKV